MKQNSVPIQESLLGAGLSGVEIAAEMAYYAKKFSKEEIFLVII